MSDDLFSTEEFYNEFPIYFKDSYHDIDCKALLDRVMIDHKNKEIILIDIKSCNTFKNFKDRVRDFNYHRQLAFYWRALLHHLKDKIDNSYVFKTYIIAINTKDIVEVKVYEIPENLLREADDEINRIMLKLQWHFENDKWEYTREYYNNNGIEKL